jgi:hypothetical protein
MSLKLNSSSGGSVTLQEPTTASNLTFTLPSADGTNGQFMQTNGSGVLSFATVTAYAGPSGQVFTSSGTFTIPTGITKLKVTVVGGGGASSFSIGGCPPSFGTGGSGGTSSVASGTQSISTISATGGSGGNGSIVNGGLGSGGDINSRGGIGGGADNPGATLLSQGTYNSTALLGTGGSSTGQTSGGGGGGAVKWLSSLTSGNTLTVTIGAGGTGGDRAGAAGAVVFEW